MPKKAKTRTLNNTIKLIIPITTSLLIAFFAIMNSGTYFNKSAKFENLDLRGMRYEKGRQLLEDIIGNQMYLNTENRSMAVNLKELEIKINENELKKFTSRCTKLGITLCMPNNKEPNPEALLELNKKKMAELTENLSENLRLLTNEPIVSFNNSEFWVLSDEAELKLQKDLKDPLQLLSVLNDKTQKINLKVIESDNPQKQLEQTENHIQQMLYPLLIKYGRTPIYIPTETLETFIEIREVGDLTHAHISLSNISSYLDTLENDYATEDVKIIRPESDEKIQRTLLLRASNYEINNAVVLPLEGKSKTNGELHDKYLEVIKSQQRLYKFENGELTKTYIVSTGLTWDTPIGNFQVLGKQKMTISYFGQWWMENYLPIGTINGYRFGFHAIPYHKDAAGNVFHRDPNTMGSPATGGCIQLVPEESLELFEWADVGTPVYIYE